MYDDSNVRMRRVTSTGHTAVDCPPPTDPFPAVESLANQKRKCSAEQPQVTADQ